MLRLVAVHDDSALGLKFPCALVDVQYDYIHAEVQSSLLGTQTCTQAGIEEYHQKGLVPSEFLIRKRIFLYIFCCCKSVFEVTELGD